MKFSRLKMARVALPIDNNWGKYKIIKTIIYKIVLNLNSKI